MSTTKLHQRIFAGFGALLFLVTASALTISVLWEAATKKDDTTTSSQTTNEVDTPKIVEGKLAGTQLKDFAPIAKTAELQKIDSKVGEDAEVKPGDTVTVDYTGAVAATGKIFESSLDSGQPATFPLSNVIVGWQEGIPGMKVGGTRRIIIPAAKAYGSTPPQGSGIPTDADLVFDVTLKKIGN